MVNKHRETQDEWYTIIIQDNKESSLYISLDVALTDQLHAQLIGLVLGCTGWGHAEATALVGAEPLLHQLGIQALCHLDLQGDTETHSVA